MTRPRVILDQVGVVQVATQAEVNTGSEDSKAVTPETLKSKALKSGTYSTELTFDEDKEIYQDVTTPVYEKIVSEVAAKYAKLKHINTADIEAEVATLKKHWKNMTKPKIKKPVKKLTKKVVAKKK